MILGLIIGMFVGMFTGVLLYHVVKSSDAVQQANRWYFAGDTIVLLESSNRPQVGLTGEILSRNDDGSAYAIQWSNGSRTCEIADDITRIRQKPQYDGW